MDVSRTTNVVFFDTRYLSVTGFRSTSANGMDRFRSVLFHGRIMLGRIGSMSFGPVILDPPLRFAFPGLFWSVSLVASATVCERFLSLVCGLKHYIHLYTLQVSLPCL